MQDLLNLLLRSYNIKNFKNRAKTGVAIGKLVRLVIFPSILPQFPVYFYKPASKPE